MVNPFTDVSEDAYNYQAILWAYASGITGGMTETTFAPNATCTRAQIVTFLHRYPLKSSALLRKLIDFEKYNVILTFN